MVDRIPRPDGPEQCPHRERHRRLSTSVENTLATRIDRVISIGDMRIYLIRHGHRADMLSDYDGGANPPLSEVGFRQAECVAGFIAAEKPDALYSSCQLRALQTAEPLYRRLGLTWNVWPAFCETNSTTWGEVAGLEPGRAERTVAWRTGTAAAELTAEQIDRLDGNFYLLSSLANRFPGAEPTQPFEWPDQWWHALEGETIESCFARIGLATRALIHRHRHTERIALVAHGNCGDLMLSSLLGLPPIVPRRFAFDTGSVTRIDIKESGGARLAYVNRTEHLPHELRD